MLEALKEAWKAFKDEEVPVGAVLVKDNRVIARGYNQVERLKDATAHAEMLCVTAGASALENWRLADAVLYTTLEPCTMCAGALYWSQISKIVFGARDEQRGFIAMGTKLHPKTTVVSGVMANEAADLMKRFFSEKRK